MVNRWLINTPSLFLPLLCFFPFDISTKEDQFGVSIQPAVGELLMPSTMTEQDFCNEQGRSRTVHHCTSGPKPPVCLTALSLKNTFLCLGMCSLLVQVLASVTHSCIELLYNDQVMSHFSAIMTSARQSVSQGELNKYGIIFMSCHSGSRPR